MQCVGYVLWRALVLFSGLSCSLTKRLVIMPQNNPPDCYDLRLTTTAAMRAGAMQTRAGQHP